MRKRLKEQFHHANVNNKKIICVIGAIITNELEMNKSIITFVDEKDEAIVRTVDENYLVNKQVIDRSDSADNGYSRGAVATRYKYS